MEDDHPIPDNSKRTHPLRILIMLIAICWTGWRILDRISSGPAKDPMQITREDMEHMDSMISSIQQHKSPYNMNRLIDAAPDEVADVLGGPGVKVKHPKAHPGITADQEMLYSDSTVDVLFAGGKAIWFDITPKQHLLWGGRPGILWLPASSPDLSQDSMEQYDSYPGIRRITFIRDQASVKEIIVAVK